MLSEKLHFLIILQCMFRSNRTDLSLSVVWYIFYHLSQKIQMFIFFLQCIANKSFKNIYWGNSLRDVLTVGATLSDSFFSSLVNRNLLKRKEVIPDGIKFFSLRLNPFLKMLTLQGSKQESPRVIQSLQLIKISIHKG